MARTALARSAVPAATAVGLLVVGYGLAAAGPDVLGGPGGIATTAGTLAALSGTYLCLLCLLLVARVPLLERSVGQDVLVGWHRTIAPWTLLLIGAHVVLVTPRLRPGRRGRRPCRALDDRHGVSVDAARRRRTSLRMVTLGVVSWRPIRRRMTYETWWVTHLYFYLAVGLAFGHQVTNGTVFPGHRTGALAVDRALRRSSRRPW